MMISHAVDFYTELPPRTNFLYISAILFRNARYRCSSAFAKSLQSVSRMGHGHGEPPYKIPDYKCFSSIKGIKQLEELEKALAKKCLKDPWIRNEVWRYHPGFGTPASRARVFFTRGMPLGLALTCVSFVVYKMLPDPHAHDDHH